MMDVHASPAHVRRRIAGGLLAFVAALLILLLAFAANILVALRATAAEAPAGERYTVSGDDVALYDLAGEVRLEPGTGSAVQVWVTRGGRDAGSLKVATGPLRGQQTLRVLFPADRVVYPRLGRWSNTQLRVGRDGTFGDRAARDVFGLRDKVRISGTGGGLEAYADLRVLVPKGQRVTMHLGVGAATVANVDGRLLVTTAAGGIDATGVRGEITLDTGSGRVRVDGMDGVLSVDTGSGDVDLARVRGERLHVDTGSGAIRGDDVVVRELSGDTGSGAIALDGVSAETVHLDTGSGSVDLAMLSDAETVDIDTGSGSITVSVPRSFGASLAVDTGSGGISADLPLTDVHREHGELRGRIGDGVGRMTLETGSGGVRIAAR